MQSIFILFVFLFGAAIGSFLNVVILRLHVGKSLDGRSECPFCKHQLNFFDLVPILSYLLLQGKCRYCNHKISAQYPIVEFLTALIFSFIFIYSSVFPDFQLLPVFQFLFSLFIASVLVVITVYDLKWGLIPDKIVIPASALAFLFKSSLFLIFDLGNPKNYIFDLLTALGIGLFFFLIILGTKGKGMGGGDFKLSIFIGLSLGWPLAIVAIFLGFLTGAFSSVMLILLGKKSFKQTVPFGPFLALGSLLAIVYGKWILELYLKSIGLN